MKSDVDRLLLVLITKIMYMCVYMYEVCPESNGPTFISPRWRYSSSSGGWHP